MLRPMRLLLPVVLIFAAIQARAQTIGDSIVVRTYSLRSLSAGDAAKLVAPYIRSPLGGVFDVGGARAITVRERASVLATVDSLLARHDRAPAVVRLSFQLITTSETAGSDPAIAPVETALRGLFKFAGYRLLAQTTSVVSDGGDFLSTMAADGKRFRVDGNVFRVTPGPDASIRLSVGLSEAGGTETDAGAVQMRAMLGGGSVLRTGLIAPMNQTIVLGSGAPEDGGRVLILVLRAELAPPLAR